MTKVPRQIRNLSIADRIDLVEAIWDSIAEEEPELHPTVEQRELLQERWDSYESNPQDTLTWEEIKASIR